MIIVDQEKYNLVRFENIVSIGISNYEGLQRITAETLGHAVYGDMTRPFSNEN